MFTQHPEARVANLAVEQHGKFTSIAVITYPPSLPSFLDHVLLALIQYY